MAGLKTLEKPADPDQVQTLSSKGEGVEGTIRDWEGAIEHFETTLTLDAKNTQAAHNLEVVKKRLEDLKKQQEEEKKKFKKQVYDNMGHLMKKMGINSSRAIAVWGIVVLEGIQKTYKVLTWKKKLLKSLEKGFSESIIKIEEENLEDIRKVKELNIELIKDNFNRRIGPLERIMINSEKGIQSIQDNINSCMNLVNEIENLLK